MGKALKKANNKQVTVYSYTKRPPFTRLIEAHRQVLVMHKKGNHVTEFPNLVGVVYLWVVIEKDYYAKYKNCDCSLEAFICKLLRN